MYSLKKIPAMVSFAFLLVLSCATLPKLSDFGFTPVYSTDFSKPDNWESLDTPIKKYGFSENYYRVSYLVDHQFTYIPYDKKIKLPYSLSATFSLALDDPEKDGNTAFVFDYTDSRNYIRFHVNAKGEYMILGYNNAELVVEYPWTASKMLKPIGSRNTIQVVQTVDTCFIFANGKFLTKFPFTPKSAEVETGFGSGCGTGDKLTMATSRFYRFELFSVK